MATLSLEYDARNSIAQKTIDYILSLGLFKIVEHKKTQKTIESEIAKQIYGVKTGEIATKPLSQLLNEL